KGMELLLSSIRMHDNSAAVRLLHGILEKGEISSKSSENRTASIAQAMRRSIVLSLPTVTATNIQKGVLLISFTATISLYLRHPHFQLFNKYFVFVLEPSWAGYADSEILAFLRRAEHCIVQATEERDRV